MIDSAALTAMQSAAGKNCYTEHAIHAPGKLRRRLSDVFRRFPAYGMEPIEIPETMCSASSFAGVQYLPEYWRSADDPKSEFMWIDSKYTFETSADSAFNCEFLAALVDALVVVAPEFAVEDFELGEALTAICVEAIEHTGGA